MIKGFDCLSACITNAENIKGNNVKDCEVYFSVGKIITYLRNGELRTNSHRRLVDMVVPIMKHGIDYILAHADSVEGYIKKQVEQKHVMIFEVDTSKLNFRNIFVENSRVEHFICISDYSEAERVVYVIDGYVPNEKETPFEGWIDIEMFLSASEGCEYNHFVRGNSSVMSDGGETATLETALETIKDYLNPQSGEIISGEAAALKWIQDISDTDDIEKLLTQFKIYGFLTVKYYICECLKIYPRYSCLWSKYNEVVTEWGKLNRYLFFAKLRKREGMLNIFKEKAMHIIQLEHEVLESVNCESCINYD